MSWYAWDIIAFRTDTRHLSTLARGAYRDLIDEYMLTRMALLDNDQALANICGLALTAWLKISADVRRFFTTVDGRLHQARCDRELDDQDSHTNKLSLHARNAAKKRWAHKRRKKQAKPDDAQAMPEPCPTMPDHATRQDSDKREESYVSSPPLSPRKRGVGSLPPEQLAEFEQWWREFPVHKGRVEAEKAWPKARGDASLGELMTAARRYAAELARPGAPKPKYAQGWLNGRRWRDEPDLPDLIPEGDRRHADRRPLSPAQSLFAGAALALAEREAQRAADRGADIDPAEPLLDRRRSGGAA